MSSARNARDAALAKAKAAAEKEREQNKGKFSYIQGDIPKLELVATTDSKGKIIGHEPCIVTALSYIPKEKNHPESEYFVDLNGAMRYYRRPFQLHKKFGPKGAEETVICPRTFNPRARCLPCMTAAELRDDGWEKNKDEIKRLSPQNRLLLLVYDHTAKDIRYMDEAFGNDSNPSFGRKLRSRIASPDAEDWVGFWFNDGFGYAWKLTYVRAVYNQREYWRLETIDFRPEKEYPIPKNVLKRMESIDLVDMLVPTSSKHMEALHYGIDEEDIAEGEDTVNTVIKDTPSTKVVEKEEPKNSTPPQQEVSEAKSNSPNFSEMSRDQLLDFAKEKNLKDDSGRDIWRFYSRKPEDEVRLVVQCALEVTESVFGDNPSEQPDKDDNTVSKCPNGHVIGKDFCDHADCRECKDKWYNMCMELNEKMKS